MRVTAGAEEEEVPVLIVGGGGAGLTSSMLLARLGWGTCWSARARPPLICPKPMS